MLTSQIDSSAHRPTSHVPCWQPQRYMRLHVPCSQSLVRPHVQNWLLAVCAAERLLLCVAGMRALAAPDLAGRSRRSEAQWTCLADRRAAARLQWGQGWFQRWKPMEVVPSKRGLRTRLLASSRAKAPAGTLPQPLPPRVPEEEDFRLYVTADPDPETTQVVEVSGEASHR